MNTQFPRARSAFTLLAPLVPVAMLGACATTGAPGGAMAPLFSQAGLPAAVQVPDGHQVAMETVGVGKITYECRARKDAAGAFEWVFVGPDATLMDRRNQTVGKYYGPPATWESRDGSKLTGTQLAVAPAPAGNIPLQLVKANPATGSGAMQGVSHIQRVATRGGVAPQTPCDSTGLGQKRAVDYQADYIFWTPVAMR